MTSDLAPVCFAWTCVYAGLAAFFFLVGPRFRGRGYELLGIAMGGVAISTLGVWIVLTSGTSSLSFWGGRVLMLGATFSPVFNTHFIYRFSRQEGGGRLLWLAYVLAGATFLADFIAACTHQADPALLDYPREYFSASPTLALFIVGLFGLHLIIDAKMLWSAFKRVGRALHLPLICIVALGPAVVFDFGLMIREGQHYFIAEALTWVYGLAIIGALLTELRGKEGLLEKTTTSLAQRTAELQNSYAEIDLIHTELSRKEQLAAVGELAAAIAHEVRNPLAIIMNAASGLRRKSLSEQDKETLLSIVDEESEHLNQLVTELLRFARPVTAAPSPASLVDICKQVQLSIAEGYEVALDYSQEEELGSVLVDPGLLRLALDNLVMNATQAMPPGGIVQLSIRLDRLSDGTSAACVDVGDTGPGMDSQELERARKPFYTTRPRGTGLGLPIVERILEAHGGEVEIRSEVGRGTTVTLKVPHEPETKGTQGRYPGSKSPSQRRRLRSISQPSLILTEQIERGPEANTEAPPPPRD